MYCLFFSEYIFSFYLNAKSMSRATLARCHGPISLDYSSPRREMEMKIVRHWNSMKMLVEKNVQGNDTSF